jgi:HlyD family secretion protein
MLDNHVSADGVGTPTRSPGIAEGLRSLQLGDSERRRPTRTRLRLPWRWIFALALLGGAAYFGYSWLPHMEQGEEVEAVVFSTEAKGETLIDKTGNVIPRERKTITPEVGGIITEVNFEEGSKVKKGQVLIRLEEARYKAELDQAKGALATAKAQRDELKAGSRPEEIEQARAALAQAQAHREFLDGEARRLARAGRGDAVTVSDYERNLGLLREAIASERSQKESLKLAELGPRAEKLLAAEAEVVRAQANLDKAQFYCDRTRILAPCDGTILQKSAEVGEAIHVDFQVGSLAVMANLNDLQAEAEVQERELGLLKDATECEVIPEAYHDRKYRAKFERVQPLVNKQRGLVKIKVAILEPDDYLLPDMNCRIVFPRGKGTSAAELPVIPAEACVHEGSDSVVYVLDRLIARRRVIDCGRTIGSSIEVRSGLRQGDVVLIGGSRPLHDGQSVRPRFNASRKGD